MSFLDPIVSSQEHEMERDTVRELYDSKKISAYLPNGLNYFHFDKPRLAVKTLLERQKEPNYVCNWCIILKFYAN